MKLFLIILLSGTTQIFSQHVRYYNPKFESNLLSYAKKLLPNGHIQIIVPFNQQQQSSEKDYVSDEQKINIFKVLKKKFKWCMPRKFKIIKKIDDDDHEFETIRIKIPTNYYNSPDYNEEFLGALGRSDDDDNGTSTDFFGDDTFDIGSYRRFMQPNINQRMLPPNLINKFTPFPKKNPFPPYSEIGPLRVVPKKPWSYHTPWRLARPGVRPLVFPLKEPAPGYLASIPPPKATTILHQSTTEENFVTVTASSIGTEWSGRPIYIREGTTTPSRKLDRLDFGSTDEDESKLPLLGVFTKEGIKDFDPKKHLVRFKAVGGVNSTAQNFLEKIK